MIVMVMGDDDGIDERYVRDFARSRCVSAGAEPGERATAVGEDRIKEYA
jgi:hypothetical protein